MSGAEAVTEGGEGVVTEPVQRLSDVEDAMREDGLQAWLREYEDRFGAISEDQLRALADRRGLTYVPPQAGGA